LGFLKKKETIQLRKYEGRVANKKQKVKIENNLTNQDDKELYSKLKAKRLEIAKSSNLPPYVIFHDKTLQAMALNKPTTHESLSSISGVGDSKILKYGDIFISEILNHNASL